MLNINYKRGMRQSIIETAAFKLENDKQLALSIVDVPGTEIAGDIVGKNVRVAIKDNGFGEDGLSVELCLKDGADLIRILQRLFRQVASFEPAITDEEE